jgi:hypothetical protein
MSMKTTIALIFGLVFQLSQVLPGTEAVKDCAPVASSCGCCADLDSCPCADDGEPLRSPMPLVPDNGSSSKILVAKVSDTCVAVESAQSPAHKPTVVAPRFGCHLSGYAGIRLSVAFCSFVI